jgi:hypothetical protein
MAVCRTNWTSEQSRIPFLGAAELPGYPSYTFAEARTLQQRIPFPILQSFSHLRPQPGRTCRPLRSRRASVTERDKIPIRRTHHGRLDEEDLGARKWRKSTEPGQGSWSAPLASPLRVSSTVSQRSHVILADRVKDPHLLLRFTVLRSIGRHLIPAPQIFPRHFNARWTTSTTFGATTTAACDWVNAWFQEAH